MTAAIYARFSSDRQSESSIDRQVDVCRTWLARAGADPDGALVFTDYATSAASLVRPGLDALLAAVRAGSVDLIVLESLDRVSRDEADTHVLSRELRYLDVRIVGVQDGYDSAREGSEMELGVRATMNAEYRRALAKKTLGGMQKRAERGLATGALSFGYRSRELPDQSGREIIVDPDAARIVVRVFELYARGRSRAEIAATLNHDGIAPPRSSRRVGAPTWQETTIRWMLANPRYAGAWAFGEREWRKVPGTQVRRPRLRDPRDVHRAEREDLRIVPADLWERVRGRSDGERRALTPRERQGSGRRTYLLSGLLRCGTCGGLMQIHGGEEGRRYYRCTASRSRGTCANRMSVREGAVREALSRAIAHELGHAKALDRVRAICERVLARRSSVQTAELDDRRRRAERAEERARRLVAAIAEGVAPAAMVDAIRKLEVEARSERAAMASIAEALRASQTLPSVDELAARVIAAAGSADHDGDVGRARDRLRAILRDGAITMEPRGDRYVARTALLPEMLLGGSGSGRGVVAIAGACSTDDATEIPLVFEVWRAAA